MYLLFLLLFPNPQLKGMNNSRRWLKTTTGNEKWNSRTMWMSGRYLDDTNGIVGLLFWLTNIVLWTICTPPPLAHTQLYTYSVTWISTSLTLRTRPWTTSKIWRRSCWVSPRLLLMMPLAWPGRGDGTPRQSVGLVLCQGSPPSPPFVHTLGSLGFRVSVPWMFCHAKTGLGTFYTPCKCGHWLLKLDIANVGPLVQYWLPKLDQGSTFGSQSWTRRPTLAAKSGPHLVHF